MSSSKSPTSFCWVRRSKRRQGCGGTVRKSASMCTASSPRGPLKRRWVPLQPRTPSSPQPPQQFVLPSLLCLIHLMHSSCTVLHNLVSCCAIQIVEGNSSPSRAVLHRWSTVLHRRLAPLGLSSFALVLHRPSLVSQGSFCTAHIRLALHMFFLYCRFAVLRSPSSTVTHSALCASWSASIEAAAVAPQVGRPLASVGFAAPPGSCHKSVSVSS